MIHARPMRLAIIAALLTAGCASPPDAPPAARDLAPASAPPAPAAPSPQPFAQEVPAAAYAIDFVPIPGDPARGIKPFWISRTEITWDAFDIFIHGLDLDPAKPAAAPDAVTRPSKPYLPPDRGFGHEGFAAITMSHQNAAAFCRWLSERSGRTIRLPTEDQWELACGSAPDSLDNAAWSAANAGNKPHPVATKSPNDFGLHDMLGNVAEWVDGRDGKPVVKGGSYRDPPASLTCDARQPTLRAWNASDPQIPKSVWWLADAPFIGFRIVCEDPSSSASRTRPAAR